MDNLLLPHSLCHMTQSILLYYHIWCITDPTILLYHHTEDRGVSHITTHNMGENHEKTWKAQIVPHRRKTVPMKIYCIPSTTENIIMEVPQKISIHKFSVALAYNGISIKIFLYAPDLE